MPEEGNFKRLGLHRAALALTAAVPDGKSYPSDSECEAVLKAYTDMLPISLETVRFALETCFPGLKI